MGKRISKKTREEAALICAMCASYPSAVSVKTMTEMEYGVQINAVSRVAVRAWAEANRRHVLAGRATIDAGALQDDYAEAEAMLRTGWSPE